MSNDIRIGSRRWIAWKLVQLAARIYDAGHYERIAITDPEGTEVIEWMIVGDLYGCGVSSQYGWDNFGSGYTAHLNWDYEPDWLDA